MKAFLAPIALAAALVSPAHAAVIHTSPTDFLPQVADGAYTETFDSVVADVPGELAYSNGRYGYTVSSPNGLYSDGRFLGVFTSTDPLVITFTGAAVTALGANFFNTQDRGDFVRTAISIALSDGTTTTLTPESIEDGYRGFLSDVAISSITLSTTALTSWVGLDNLTVGASLAEVPEPASLALAGIGMLGLLGLSARRRGRA